MNKILLSILCLFLFFTFGCGHNIIKTDNGIGLSLKLPLPNGNSLVDLKIGYIDSKTTIIRGNTTVDMSNASGGSGLSFDGGTSQVILIKSGPQLNQEYIAKILTDSNADTKTKEAIAQYLVNCKQLRLKPTSLTVSNGGITTGQNPKKAESVKNDFNVVDKVLNNYQTTINKKTYSTKTNWQNIIDIIIKHIKLISIFFFITIMLIVIIIFILKVYIEKNSEEKI